MLFLRMISKARQRNLIALHVAYIPRGTNGALDINIPQNARKDYSVGSICHNSVIKRPVRLDFCEGW